MITERAALLERIHDISQRAQSAERHAVNLILVPDERLISSLEKLGQEVNDLVQALRKRP